MAIGRIPPDGGNSVDLDGLAPGSISQSFDTTAGDKYVLTFYLAGNPDGGPGIKSTTVDVGSTAKTFTYDVHGSQSETNMEWQKETLLFTGGAGTSTALEFASNTTGAFGPVIGDVSARAAPEPATWSLMIIGVGMAGGALRSARKSRRLSLVRAA
jgi:hypothetical protein